MSKYTWTSSREISGFGGGYENECRAMVIRGWEHYDENPDIDPEFHGFKGVYGIIEEDNDDARALVKAMLGDDENAGGGHTGAMVQATVGHVLAAKVRDWTWEEYQAELEKTEDEDDTAQREAE